MKYTYTWVVEQRSSSNAPWRVVDMDTEPSNVDMLVFGELKQQELKRWDFKGPHTRLTVHSWKQSCK